jgi:hypothetical protein
MSRLEVKRWQGRAADLYDILTELVNAGALNQMPVSLVTRAMDQLTAYAVDCHLDEPTPKQETNNANQ